MPKPKRLSKAKWFLLLSVLSAFLAAVLALKGMGFL